MEIRDRIKELRRVKASELRPSPKNWRTHPKAQKEALQGVLSEIGYADALLVRELPDGSLVLVDGHLRAETTPDSLVPVLILDVTEVEADKILATLDPLAAMAEADAGKLDALLREVNTGSEAVAAMLAELAENAGIVPGDDADLPDLPDSDSRQITLRFTDVDENALKAFVGQDDDKPIAPVQTGAKILERIKEVVAAESAAE